MAVPVSFLVPKKEAKKSTDKKTKATVDTKPKVRDIDEIAKDTTGAVAVVNPYAVKDLRDVTDNITGELPPEDLVLETEKDEEGQMQFESLDDVMDEDMEPDDMFDEPSEDPFEDLGDDDAFADEDDDDSYF